MKNPWHLLKQLLPWLVAIGIFYWLFKKYPPAQVFSNIRDINLFAFFGLSLFYVGYVALIDSYGLAWTLSRFDCKVSLKEMIPPRFTSYLVAILNYNAGQAMLTLYLKKSHRYSPFKTLGAILLLMLMDFFLIITLCVVSSFFVNLQVRGIDLSAWIQKFGLVFYVSLLIVALLRKRLPAFIHQKKIFQALHQATYRDILTMIGLRIPIHFGFIFCIYFLLKIFHAHVPFTSLILSIPLALLIGAVPITPGGLGTIQAAIVELLKDQIHSPLFLSGTTRPEDLLFAASLLWIFCNYLLKATVGLFYLRKVSKVVGSILPSEAN